MLKKIALAGIFAVVSVVSFNSVASKAAPSAQGASVSERVDLEITRPVMKGLPVCNGCR